MLLFIHLVYLLCSVELDIYSPTESSTAASFLLSKEEEEEEELPVAISARTRCQSERWLLGSEAISRITYLQATECAIKLFKRARFTFIRCPACSKH